MKKLLFNQLIFFLLLLLASPARGAVDTHYVTQSGAGGYTGVDLANAFSAANHNTAGNWDTDVDDDNKIGPGDTIYLSGTITTKLEPEGDGASGNYITYDGYEAGSYNATDGNRTNLASLAVVRQIEIESKSYFNIQDINFDGDSGAKSIGLTLIGDPADPASYIVVKDCYFHHYANEGIFCVYATAGISHSGSVTELTIGGASGDGCEFYNIGDNTGAYDVKVAYTHDFTVSYNKLWADDTDYGVDGISWGNSRTNTSDGIIEYNYVASHHQDPYGEGGISGKGGSNITVRYNYIYDETNTSEGKGTGAWGDAYNMKIYGNYIEACNWGMWVTTGSGADVNENGVKCEKIYIFSNIIIDSIAGEGIAVGGWAGTDAIGEVHIYNNTICDSGTSPDNSYDTGIAVRSRVDGPIYIKNNIFYNNRPSESDYVQLYVSDASDATVQYNRFYHTGSTAKVYWEGSTLDADSATVGSNNTIGDPSFTNAGADDWTLDGTYKNSGVNLGGEYNSALGPTDTDWTTIPPTVSIESQDDHGAGWEQGAYVYEEGGPPGGGGPENVTFFCTWEGVWGAPTYTMHGTKDHSAGDTTGTADSACVVNTDAAIVGTYGLDSPTFNDFMSFTVSSDDIVSGTAGRIGRYTRITTYASGNFIINVEETAGVDVFQLQLDGTDELEFYWEDGNTPATAFVTTTANLSTGVEYYLEIAYDTVTNYREIFVDGVSKGTSSAAIGSISPVLLQIGLGNMAADIHTDNVIISSDSADDLNAWKDEPDYSAIDAGTTPTIDEVGHIADPDGTPVYTANKTETWSTLGDLKYVGLKLSEQINYGGPEVPYLSLAPTVGTMVGKYHKQVVISTVYYLVFEFKVGYTWNYSYNRWDAAAGHRNLDLQTGTAATALQLNGSTMTDGEEPPINLTTTLPGTDIGTITLANPKTANEPFTIKASGGDGTDLADLVTNVDHLVPDDVIVGYWIEVTATVPISGTSGHQLIFYIYYLDGDLDLDGKDYITVRGTNRITGSVLNSGGIGVVLLPYSSTMVTN